LLSLNTDDLSSQLTRRGDVVGEAAVLVKGQDEEGLVPLRAGAQGLVDLLDERLAVVDG